VVATDRQRNGYGRRGVAAASRLTAGVVSVVEVRAKLASKPPAFD
jgi:biotin-(acetyl-CoA carboxylase) ligase